MRTRFGQKILLRLKSLFKRKGAEQDLSDELRFHLDFEVERRIAGGMAPEQARYAALRELGRVEQMAKCVPPDGATQAQAR